MRKRVVSLAFVFTMALGAVTGPAQVAVAAPHEPAEQAVCVAETINGAIQSFSGKGFSKGAVLPDAHGTVDGEVGAGGFIAPRASNDDCSDSP